MAPLKVAIIVADEREARKKYDLPEPYFGPAPSTLLAGLRQTPGVEVHIVSCVRQRVSEPARLAGNIYYHALPVPRWGFLKTAFLPAILAIRKKLRFIRPDVVHGQGTESYYALGAAHSGFPNLITIHGNMRQVARALGARPFSFYWLIARLETWAVRRTGGVLCLTRYTQQQVESLARKTWVLPNAVDEAFFRVERSAPQTPTLLCVANITSYKGQNELMRALDPIAAERTFRLIFLGAVNENDPYGNKFLELVKARAWCEYKGYEKGDALRAHFQSASMLLLPSREDNCPMVVLEAMAAGVPVGASRIGGIPDLIDPGKNGLLFDPSDAAQIRSAVVEVLSAPERAAAMAARARDHALNCYHPVEIARRHFHIYQEMLA